MVRRVFLAGALAVNNKVTRIHLLIQSTGGFVGDGIGLYNYLRGLPIEFVTYNGGTVSSIAVMIYLAGKIRNASKTATFMLHRSTGGAAAPADRLKLVTKSLLIDDDRSDAILREHINLSAERWQEIERGELVLTAEESTQVGLAHAVKDFVVPPDRQLFNL